RRYPLLEAAMGRAARADAGGVQSVPLAARTQHEENGVEGTAVVHPGGMTAQRGGLAGRQQPLGLGPEFIRDAPGAACLLSFHPFPSCGNSCRLLESFDGPRGSSYRDRLLALTIAREPCGSRPKASSVHSRFPERRWSPSAFALR